MIPTVDSRFLSPRYTRHISYLSFYKWNPALQDEIRASLGWNLQPVASDEIKSASYLPASAGFHRVAISSTAGGFLPQKADLVKKEQVFRLALFLEVQAGFEPADNGVADRGLTTWLRHQILCSFRTPIYYNKLAPVCQALFCKIFDLFLTYFRYTGNSRNNCTNRSPSIKNYE